MFSLSPAVEVREFDLSLTIKQLPSSKTGFVLRSDYGEALKVVQVDNERDLIEKFGKPTNLNYKDWFNVWNYLQYSQPAFVVRPLDPSTKNVGKYIYMKNENGTKTLTVEDAGVGEMYNRDIAEKTLRNLVIDKKFLFINKYVTSKQDIAITIASDETAFNSPITADTTQVFVPEIQSTDGTNVIKFSELFDYVPDFANGEFAIVILKRQPNGLFDIVEKYILSYKEDGKDAYGNNIFAETFLFERSLYIYCKLGDGDPVSTHTLKVADLTFKITEDDEVYPKVGSVQNKNIKYSGVYEKADIQNAFQLFANPEEIDINILVGHELDLDIAARIATDRKDCIAIITPYEQDEFIAKPSSNVTQYLINAYGTRTSPMNPNRKFRTFTSYAAIFGNIKYQYDKFNDVNRWMSLGGDIAGIISQMDREFDPWWAPAGLTRGKIKNVIKLGFNPLKSDRDQLYINAINPIMSVKGEGVGIIWGQKTALARPSAFDRINVRRLLITLEKAIATYAKYALFEFNDEFTRARIKGIIEPYLRDIKGRRGLYDYMVVCDSSNNDQNVIDNNELVIDIYLQPEKVAEVIQLNMKVTRTGVNFEELIGKTV